MRTLFTFVLTLGLSSASFASVATNARPLATHGLNSANTLTTTSVSELPLPDPHSPKFPLELPLPDPHSPKFPLFAELPLPDPHSPKFPLELPLPDPHSPKFPLFAPKV